MKNLKVMLTLAALLSCGSVICSDPAIDAVRMQNALELKKEACAKMTAIDKNVKCKVSPNKQFCAVMLRDAKGYGKSVTVYNLDTKTIVLELTFNSKLASGFTLKDETIKIFFRKGFKSVTYALVAPKCKKCKTQLADNCDSCGQPRIGQIAKARILGFVPARKK